MVREDYVSLETAMLLKEKGFDGYCDLCFNFIEIPRRVVNVPSGGKVSYEDGILKEEIVLVPTLQMAIKWLRDVHDLIISVDFTIHGWLCGIAKVFRDSSGFIVNINHGIDDSALPYCDEYEKSCETALKHCLENLI